MHTINAIVQIFYGHVRERDRDAAFSNICIQIILLQEDRDNAVIRSIQQDHLSSNHSCVRYSLIKCSLRLK